MVFGRSSNMDLPMASQSSFKGGGKSIQMEAPVVRAIRNASLYTKISYLWLLFSIFMIFMGIKNMLASSGSKVLICTYPGYCTLKIKEPYGSGKVAVKIHRDQIVRSNQIEINENEEITKYITREDEPNPDFVASDFGTKTSVSYTLVLKPFDSNSMDVNEFIRVDENEKYVAHEEPPTEAELRSNLSQLGLERNQQGEYVIIMRHYAKNKRRGSVRQQHSRLKAYMKNRRKKVTVREAKALSWFAVLSFVFGLFSTLLTLLLGQFWEEDKRPFVSRRVRQQSQGIPSQVNKSRSTSRTSAVSVGYGSSGYSSGTVKGRHSVVNRRR